MWRMKTIKVKNLIHWNDMTKEYEHWICKEDVLGLIDEMTTTYNRDIDARKLKARITG